MVNDYRTDTAENQVSYQIQGSYYQWFKEIFPINNRYLIHLFQWMFMTNKHTDGLSRDFSCSIMV